MSEYRKQIAIGSALAIILALGLGLGIVYLPSQPGATSSSSITSVRTGSGGTTLTSAGTTHTTIGTTSLQTYPSSVPAALEGYVSTQNVSCSLTTGVCNLTVVYNGTDPLQLEGCQFAIANSTGGLSLVNGTVGGAATAGIAPNSQVSATCSIAISELAHQTEGSRASGSFSVKLVDSWNAFPAGTVAYFGFQGIWS